VLYGNRQIIWGWGFPSSPSLVLFHKEIDMNVIALVFFIAAFFSFLAKAFGVPAKVDFFALAWAFVLIGWLILNFA